MDIDQKQKELLINYFKREEKEKSEFLLGIEIEHLVINKDDLSTVSYFAPMGIESILEDLQTNNWISIREKDHLVGLQKDKMSISLEPGGQLEISIIPRHTIKEIDNIYQSFLKQILPILKKRKKLLSNLGYQPESQIDDIPLLPKKRYNFMYEYFKSRGNYAHNMMKGTASIHVSLDYKNEKDFARKCRVSSFFAPFIYVLFDNSPFFEGKIYSNPALRSLIWDNCDRDRCGPLPEIFVGEYGYEQYAEFILQTPPMLWKEEGNLTFTGSTLLKDIMDPAQISREQIEHILTMVFPEIRIKNCLEIRVADSLPYPYNMGYLALWQGILYNDELLKELDEMIAGYSVSEINQLRENILQKGLRACFRGKNLIDYFNILLTKVRKGLSAGSRVYLDQLQEIFSGRQNLHQKILSNLDQGKKRALNPCIIEEDDLN